MGQTLKGTRYTYITQILAARWVSAINRLDCRQSSENGGVKQDTTALESLPPYPCTVIYSLHHVLLHQFMDVKWGGRLLSRELECCTYSRARQRDISVHHTRRTGAGTVPGSTTVLCTVRVLHCRSSYRTRTVYGNISHAAGSKRAAAFSEAFSHSKLLSTKNETPEKS